MFIKVVELLDGLAMVVRVSALAHSRFTSCEAPRAIPLRRYPAATGNSKPLREYPRSALW